MNRGENIDMNMNANKNANMNNMELTDLEIELFHKDDKKEEIDTGSTEYIVSFNSSKVAKIDKEIIRVALENFVMNMLSDLSISCTIENKKEL
jgi:putative exporter of polyketide antibiotics